MVALGRALNASGFSWRESAGQIVRYFTAPSRLTLRGFPLTFPASKRTVAREDLKVAQVVGDPPTLVVEPKGSRAQDDLVLVVAAPNGGLLRRLLVFVPKLDVRVATLALEVLGALLGNFERALERRLDGAWRPGAAEVLFGLFSDLRQDLGFESRHEGYQLGRRPEAEV